MRKTEFKKDHYYRRETWAPSRTNALLFDGQNLKFGETTWDTHGGDGGWVECDRNGIRIPEKEGELFYRVLGAVESKRVYWGEWGATELCPDRSSRKLSWARDTMGWMPNPYTREEAVIVDPKLCYPPAAKHLRLYVNHKLVTKPVKLRGGEQWELRWVPADPTTMFVKASWGSGSTYCVAKAERGIIKFAIEYHECGAHVIHDPALVDCLYREAAKRGLGVKAPGWVADPAKDSPLEDSRDEEDELETTKAALAAKTEEAINWQTRALFAEAVHAEAEDELARIGQDAATLREKSEKHTALVDQLAADLKEARARLRATADSNLSLKHDLRAAEDQLREAEAKIQKQEKISPGDVVYNKLTGRKGILADNDHNNHYVRVYYGLDGNAGSDRLHPKAKTTYTDMVYPALLTKTPPVRDRFAWAPAFAVVVIASCLMAAMMVGGIL